MSGRDDRVGYGKPPAHSRFRKGQSGNPVGRPRKRQAPSRPIASTTAQLIRNELDREIEVTEHGQAKKLSIREAAARRLIGKGLGGHHQAIIALFGYDALAGIDEQDRMEASYRYWQGFIREQRSSPLDWPLDPRKQQGWPHPRDLYLDPVRRRIDFTGPMTVEEVPLFLVAPLQRDWLLALTTLAARHHDVSAAAVDILAGLAMAFHRHVSPSLGGLRDDEDSVQGNHSLAAMMLARRQYSDAALVQRLAVLDQQLQQLSLPRDCALALARLTAPVEQRDSDDPATVVRLTEPGSKRGRSAIACRPFDLAATDIAHIPVLLARGMSCADILASATDARKVRSAIRHFCGQYSLQLDRLTDIRSRVLPHLPLPASPGSVRYMMRTLRKNAPTLHVLRVGTTPLFTILHRHCTRFALVMQAIAAREVTRCEVAIRASSPERLRPGASAETMDLIRREILGINF